MVLRELLAVFGLEFDDQGMKKAERGIKTLQEETDQLASTFSRGFTAAAIAAPFLFLAKLGSDAQENLNLLGVAFGENAEDVIRWSETASKAMGRSKYTLQELAAEFGGFLKPVTESSEEAAHMSQSLSELAVDLTSLRNLAGGEKEALQVFRSALSGETEAIKRFGVNLRAAAVEQEAVRMGLGRNVKDLTEAQRVQLRYNILMRDLAFVQGDAAKTQFQFANASRTLLDRLKDIGTELGLFLLPGMEGALYFMNQMLYPIVNLAGAFRKWAADTNLAQGAVLALAIIISASLLPILAKLLPFIVAFGLLTLLLDDVITAFQGGESVLLSFANILDKLEAEGFPGMNKGLAMLIAGFNRFRDVVGGVMAFVVSIFKSLISGSMRPLVRMTRVLQNSFFGFLDSLGKVGTGIRHLLNFTINRFIEMASILAAVVKSIATGSVKPLKAALDATAAGFADDIGLPAPETLLRQGGNFLRQTGNQISSGASAVAGAIRGEFNATFNIQQQPGEDSEALAQRVGEIVEEKQRQRDEEVFTGLVQTSEAGVTPAP